MSRISRKRKASSRRRTPVNQRAEILPSHDFDLDDSSKRRFEIFILIVLLAFGVYKAVVLFGAIPVPNPDYSGFVATGKSILRFRLPGSFKRAPVLGVLQVGLGRFVGGAHPILTASWLLNAIFSVFNVVLMWQVGKKFIGNSAIWLGIVIMLNPWVLQYQAVPIAETSMIFFALVTFYFMLKRSNWAYVFAGLAPMVRYELVALILIVFVMDMVNRKTRKERWLAFLWAALASVPFLLWMLGTALTWKTSSHSHYIRHYSNFLQNKGKSVKGSGYKRFLYLLWHASFLPLFQLPAELKATFVGVTSELQVENIKASMGLLYLCSKIFAWVGVITAAVYGVCKRCWKILAILLFLALYITVHSLRINTHTRYCVPAIWLTLLLSWTGLYYCWKLINRKNRVPKPVIIVMQIITIGVASVWLIRCLPYLPKTANRCQSAATLPYIAMAAIVLIFIIRRCFFKLKFLSRDILFTVLICLMVVSQHFVTTRVIANGTYNIEFKKLSDWYVSNAQPGEKIACTWAHLLRLIADKHRRNIVGIAPYKGKTMEEFVQNCRDNNIIYVGWTHRGSGKLRKGMEHILTILQNPQSNQYWKFVGRIEIPSQKNNRWINIFKLRPLSPPASLPLTGENGELN